MREQLPYESVTAVRYREATARLKPLRFDGLPSRNPSAPDKFCDADRCEMEHPGEAPAAAGQQPETVDRESARQAKDE